MQNKFLKILPIIALFTCASLNATKILYKKNQFIKEESPLRSELEHAYNNLRTVIKDQGTLAAFTSVFELNDDPNFPPITEEEWPEMRKIMNDGFPDLNKVHFVLAEQEEEYAYYYGWGEAADLAKMHVKNYVFHKTSQGWKLTGYSRTRYTNKAATVEENTIIVQKLIPALKKEAIDAQNHK